jgi:hypothetical protein
MAIGNFRARGAYVGLALGMCVFTSSPALAGAILLNTFYEFSFTDPGVTALGCQPDDPAGEFCTPSSGTPTVFLDAPPWTFTAGPAGVALTVTDAFETGDQFEVLDFGIPIGFTSVPDPGFDCGDDPVPCLADPHVSSRVFLLAGGDHSITIAPLQVVGFGGAGYLHVAEVPEPGALSLLVFGLLGLTSSRRRSLGGVT